MIRVLPIILALSIAIYCLVECIQTDRQLVRYLPKALWLFLILIPVIGPIGWLLAGRPRTVRTQPTTRPTASRRAPPAPRAPDDDPAFLARLDEQSRLAAREREARRLEESAQGESAPKESAQKESAPKESAQKDTTKKDATKKDTVEKDTVETDEGPESRRDPGP